MLNVVYLIRLQNSGVMKIKTQRVISEIMLVLMNFWYYQIWKVIMR